MYCCVVKVQSNELTYVRCHHRLWEWFGLKGTLNIISYQPLLHEQGHLTHGQGSIQDHLEHFEEWSIRNLSGQTVPVPHHSSKEFIPNVQAFWAAYPASHSPAPPIPSQQDCRWSVYCPACMDSEGCLTLVQHLALILVESREVHMRPLLKLLQIPLGGILTSRSVSCTTQLVESWGVPMTSKIWWSSDQVPLLSLSSS